MFELSGVNYEEVLEQGDSILVQVIASSSYRGFELSGLYCNNKILILYIIIIYYYILVLPAGKYTLLIGRYVPTKLAIVCFRIMKHFLLRRHESCFDK